MGSGLETLTAWREATHDIACRSVCQFRGRPLGTIDTVWKSACIQLGLATGTWKKGGWTAYAGPLIHDLRRSGLRNLIRAGVDRDIARSISGHLTDAVFSRYNIVNETDLEEAGRKVVAANRGDNRIGSIASGITPDEPLALALVK